MILTHRAIKLAQQLVRLLRTQLVNATWERPQRVQRLPPCHRVRPDDRMHGGEVRTDIKRVTARLGVDLDVLRVVRSSLEEALTDECSREGLEEAAVGWRETVEELVARRPERVSAGAGQLRQAQGGVVCGGGLELDVRVPLRGVVVALVGLGAVSEHLLAREGADRADLGVWDAELVCVVEDWVDVEGGVGGFAGLEA